MARKDFLPFSFPLLGPEEISEVIATMRSGWITTGPRVSRFEEKFAEFLDAPAALAVSSGTAALHLALTVLNVGPGDAVVTTPMTFCSTVHVIEQAGAKPLLVDVEPDTLNIDPSKIEDAILRAGSGRRDARVKAILPVHLYGQPCDLDGVRAIANKHGLHIVEDAAHALPAEYGNRMIGAVSGADASGLMNLVAFSFYATKNLTTAEGGMLIGPQHLVEDARIWSLHGMSRDAFQRYTAHGSWHYEVVVPGFKYNMTDIQAAIGLHQLAKLPALQARRRQIVERYNDGLRGLAQVELPSERTGVEHAWHIYQLRLHLDLLTIDRSRFIDELKCANIGTSVHFIPVHLHPYYRDKYLFKPHDFPIAYREYQRLVSLPLNPQMSNRDVDDVIGAVIAVANRHGA